ncbi:glycosyltransferase family 4 protein [Fusicatenibacter faecihominis]|uniref:Glycosyltransferase family 4 protein n=1 Tax=Fusicatenibacter faecihominis TaxID=2881276 RepID=A0AAE3DV01_9FIRM|nr:glycosyltransferase family 4 protein [Fusicatenibacter faecihominis]MCC2190988.1 glycosyltransferase family 4 protein [Fusicatenibacter faecihominis]
MNILFLDAYYEPETIAYTHLERDLIEGLISDGHKIDIICPIPTRGIDKKTREKYKNKKLEKKYNGFVTVKRFMAPQEGKNPLGRAFRYFWCNFRTYQIAVKNKDIDIVFSNSTPPTQGALSALVARKLSKKTGKKVPFLYNLQDIFPDSLVNSNLTHKDSILWKIGRKLEGFTYRNADKIIVISKSFKKNLLAKGVSEKKVEIISNWIDLESVHPVERKDNKLIDEFNLDPSKFLVVYAGNFGASQGADIILKVADQLKEYDDIQFLILGGGAEFDKAKKTVADNQMSNVIIHGLLPSNRISEVYSLGNIALITCKKGVGKAGMPSKTWSIMACNTPIVASFDTGSELDDILSSANAGICIEPENPEKLKDSILDYKEKSCSNRSNARNYVFEHVSKKVCVNKYLDMFKVCTKN